MSKYNAVFMLVLAASLLFGSIPAAAAPSETPAITLSCAECRILQAIRIDGSGFDPSMRFGLRYGDAAGSEWSGGLWSYANPDGTIHATLRFTVAGNYYVYAYQIRSERSKKIFNKTEPVWFVVQ